MTSLEFSPRKPLVALALSIMLPGMGQLYNGQLNKGVFLFLGCAFISLPFIVIVALSLPPAWFMPLLLLSLGTTLGLYLFGLWDAWRVAWQQPAIYLSLLLFAFLVVIGGMTRYIRGQLVESFYIPSESMAPNVLRGDILFADKRVNCPGCKQSIRRGDIAIFVYPNNRTLLYIKRIIGLPGDRIRIEGRRVFVNDRGITAAEPTELVQEHGDSGDYLVRWPRADEAEPFNLTVPPGQVFVLGDNRDAAKDSRSFGTVPLMDVIGRAKQIWFSYTEASGIRWERLGRVLE